MARRILFLGGTRFIGPPAVARLCAAGHAVACFHRGEHDDPRLAAVERLRGDRRRIAEHAAALRQWRPDVVVDMVMRGDADARAVQAVFAGTAARLVALSSADVYAAFGRVNGIEPGPPDPAPLTEEAPLRTVRFPYRGKIPGADDYEKILGEAVVLGAPALPGVVLRLPMVYGPGDYQYRFRDWLQRMDDRRPAIPVGRGFGAWRCSCAFVDDVGRAIELAATHPAAAGVYNVAEADCPSVAEWAALLAAASGWTGRVVDVPKSVAPEALRGTECDAQPVVLASGRIRRTLGYGETAPRATALAATIAWQRAHPPSGPGARPDYAADDAALAALGR
jgi:nucleoside-diphosphate-sugar epimerase